MNQSREEILFTLVLSKPAGERGELLDAVCRDDYDLRERVEALLAAREQAGGVSPADPHARTILDCLSRSTLTKPTAPLLGPKEPEAPLKTDSADSPGDDAVGQIIGRYRLLEKLGEGGFGVVYVAEQREPVRRRVAFKIIKLGMDTTEVVARFEAERQALAMMDHPSIAKVLDGGATNFGRPYFVMELVRGIPITKYCDDHRLSLSSRMSLFNKVCQAIQHAHQKGIIHRDIKPSNILVIEQDGAPVPMIIDFGIAKATSGDLTEKTIHTKFHQFMGTPAYMSPEQVGGSSLDIDTRSDIYSLGVLLYELLTGRTPFDHDQLTQAGMEELRRILCNVEPPLPSARLSALPAPDSLSVAHARQSDPKRLGSLLHGDLDWIVMKAIEKDRVRRYATSSAMAEDIRRFLNNEPVSAVAPDFSYRLSKFARRNRGAVVVALAGVALLLGVASLTTWLAVTATRARETAAREARKSAQVARFLQDMLEAVRPAKARGRDTAMLRELLDLTSDRVGRDLRDQPEVEFELRGTIGRTYEALGADEPAEVAQRTALTLARGLYGDSHTNTARALEDLGLTLVRRGQFSEATNVLHQALSIFRRQLGEKHPATAGPLHRLGGVYSTQGDYAAAEPLLQTALEIRRKNLPQDHPSIFPAALDLVTLYYQQNRLESMAPLIISTYEASARSLGADHPVTLDAMALLAILKQAQGRFEDAERLHVQLIEIKRRVLGADHLFTLTSMDNLAIIYGFQGRYKEAEDLCRRALAAHESQKGSEHRNTLAMRSNLAEYVRNQGRYAESEELFKQVMESQSRTMSATDPFRQETMAGFALQCLIQGRETEAEALLNDLLRIRRASLPANDPALADTLAQLTLVLLAQGRPEEAAPLATQCRNIRQAVPFRDWRTFVAESQLGACHLELNQVAQAESLLVEGFEGLKLREHQIPAIELARVREAIERLVKLGQIAGHSEKVTSWRKELEQFQARELARQEAARAQKTVP